MSIKYIFIKYKQNTQFYVVIIQKITEVLRTKQKNNDFVHIFYVLVYTFVTDTEFD